MQWDEVYRVCYEYTLVGLRAIFEARGLNKTTPLRFLYMSGVAAERDQSKTPWFKPRYSLMRVRAIFLAPPPLQNSGGHLTSAQGETESQVLAFASTHPGQVEVTVAKPGAITQPGNTFHWLRSWLLWLVASVPSIGNDEIAAAMLAQVVDGFEKDPLPNADLVRIGQKVLKERKP